MGQHYITGAREGTCGGKDPLGWGSRFVGEDVEASGKQEVFKIRITIPLKLSFWPSNSINFLYICSFFFLAIFIC